MQGVAVVTPLDEPSYYTVAQAARILRVDPSTVWRWIESEKLLAYRVGRRTIRIRPRDLEALVQPARAGHESLSARKTYVPKRATEPELARRREAIDWILAHQVSIAPLTTADLVHKVRAERMKHDPPR
jgi:excisionase family DNA binding protein